MYKTVVSFKASPSRWLLMAGFFKNSLAQSNLKHGKDNGCHGE